MNKAEITHLYVQVKHEVETIASNTEISEHDIHAIVANTLIKIVYTLGHIDSSYEYTIEDMILHESRAAVVDWVRHGHAQQAQDNELKALLGDGGIDAINKLLYPHRPNQSIPMVNDPKDLIDVNKKIPIIASSTYNAEKRDGRLTPPLPPRTSTALNDLMATMPKEGAALADAYQQLGDLSHAFREQVAKRLEPTLNAHIQAMPQETLEDKKAICDVVEKTLKPLGLAVKVPNTPGLPGKLKATSGHWPGRGRFYFEVYIDGKPKRPALSDTTPNLELIDATPVTHAAVNAPNATEGDWQKTVGPKSSRQGHRRS